MNNFGVRAIAKTIKELGLDDHRTFKFGNVPNLNSSAYYEEGQMVERIKIDSSNFGATKEEREFLTKGFNSEPEVIDDFKYVKPIRLLTPEDIINFCRKDK